MGGLKRKLRNAFSCNQGFNRWCLKMKRSWDEVCALLGCPCKCRKEDCHKEERHKNECRNNKFKRGR